MAWPVPIGPVGMTLPNADSTGVTRATSTAVPPAMIASVPLIAFGTPPDTGASTMVMFLAARS